MWGGVLSTGGVLFSVLYGNLSCNVLFASEISKALFVAYICLTFIRHADSRLETSSHTRNEFTVQAEHRVKQ